MITLSDKPKVERHKSTNNYVLYEQLKRTGKDHALLIATENYSGSEFENLKNPIRDAEAIANDLTSIYGFDCEIIRNPSKIDFLKCLEKYQKRLFETDEQLFIFISGHGKYDEGTKDGYLIPTDGKFGDITHSTWISYDELLNNINKIKSNHILLAIDACYSGALQFAVAKTKSDSDDDFGTKLQDTKRWFLNRIRFKTKIYITSTAADRLSSDGINHSPFASRFLQGLRTFGDESYVLTISQIYGYIDGIDPPPTYNSFGDNEVQSSFFFIMK
jgi:hypothetical protein